MDIFLLKFILYMFEMIHFENTMFPKIDDLRWQNVIVVHTRFIVNICFNS